jgi:7,8-dihydroneopterin aldolase/epimerase/oxygenase
MKVELKGLHVFGYHGVEEDERRHGQLFLFDISMEVGDRGVSDRLEDAVDYRLVAECVREVSRRRFNLLEALASAVADTLMERFTPERLAVRVRKPQVQPAGLTVEYGAVTVVRDADERP